MTVKKFIPPKSREDSSQTQCIAFLHHKGSTEKTTACLNIASCLAKMSQKILVVDLYSHANAMGIGSDLKSIQYPMCAAQRKGLSISPYASHLNVSKTYLQIDKDICIMNIEIKQVRSMS